MDSTVAGASDGLSAEQLWSTSRSGATSARVYHYQDVVGAWLCARVLAGRLAVTQIVPESLEDLSGEGADACHVQVKSRQERKGNFTTGQAARFLLDLFDLHVKREGADVLAWWAACASPSVVTLGPSWRGTGGGDVEGYQPVELGNLGAPWQQPLVADPKITLLPLRDLRWEDFERLLLDFAHVQDNLVEAFRFGTAGQAQAGIDVAGRSQNGRWNAYQAKKVDRLTEAHVRAALDAFANGCRPFSAGRLVIATTSEGTRYASQRTDPCLPA